MPKEKHYVHEGAKEWKDVVRKRTGIEMKKTFELVLTINVNTLQRSAEVKTGRCKQEIVKSERKPVKRLFEVKPYYLGPPPPYRGGD